jgi:hypothetical protein
LWLIKEETAAQGACSERAKACGPTVTQTSPVVAEVSRGGNGGPPSGVNWKKVDEVIRRATLTTVRSGFGPSVFDEKSNDFTQ